MSDSVRPHRQKPTRLPHPRDSLGKNTGVGCLFLLQCMKVKSKREVAQSCPTLCDPMDCSHQAPPSMGFSRQGYWSGLPVPSLNLAIILPKLTYRVNRIPIKIQAGNFFFLEIYNMTLNYGNESGNLEKEQSWKMDTI